jgi:hypothetical protein
MQKWLLVFLLLPMLATAQLKEFEVSEMERPDVAVVQANTQWPDDALLLVYSSLDGVQFRSSMGVIHKQTYNSTANRYEILTAPVKQMIFVAKKGFIELKISTINPNPKDVFYYEVEETRFDFNASDISSFSQSENGDDQIYLEDVLSDPTLSYSNRDTVWLNNSTEEFFTCEILGYYSCSNKLIISVNQKVKDVFLTSVIKYSWNGKRYRGDIDMRTVKCQDLPFIPFNPEGELFQQKRFYYTGFPPNLAYEHYKQAILNNSITDLENARWDDDNLSLHVFGEFTREVCPESAVSYDLVVGLNINISFADNYATWQSSISKIEFPGGEVSPKTYLLEKYSRKNGVAKKDNYDACENCNNLMSSMYRLQHVLNDVVMGGLNSLNSFRESSAEFDEYVLTNTVDQVEGKWSVFVSLQNGQQIATFEIGIKKESERYVSVPLSINAYSYIGPLSYIEPTSEELTFLLTDSRSNSIGSFQLTSSVIAKSSITLPRELWNGIVGKEIASRNGMSPILNYRLIKKRN